MMTPQCVFFCVDEVGAGDFLAVVLNGLCGECIRGDGRGRETQCVGLVTVIGSAWCVEIRWVLDAQRGSLVSSDGVLRRLGPDVEVYYLGLEP
jgi:hypothetical protein